MATNPQVDSRAYAFAYVIRTLADFPADFRVPQAESGFSIGLFLPQESAGVFSISVYPAHILMLFHDVILVATHPSAETTEHWISTADIVWMELKRYLLDGGLTLQTRQRRYTFQFNARDTAAVEEFVAPVRAAVAPAVQAEATAVLSYGAPLDLKFGRAERANLQPGEQLLLRFFIPPLQQMQRRLHLSEVGIDRRRLCRVYQSSDFVVDRAQWNNPGSVWHDSVRKFYAAGFEVEHVTGW